jgi:phthalate 4,5-cis-dihydrodiol dehydrogenase
MRDIVRSGDLGRLAMINAWNYTDYLWELTPAEEASFKTQRLGYGGPVARNYAATEANRKQPHFGIVIATCERGDLRPCPDGVLIYGDDGPRTVPAHVGRGAYGQGDTIDELYDALVGTQPTLRDAAFGRNTVLACLAVLQSSKTGREVPVLP